MLDGTGVNTNFLMQAPNIILFAGHLLLVYIKAKGHLSWSSGDCNTWRVFCASQSAVTTLYESVAYLRGENGSHASSVILGLLDHMLLLPEVVLPLNALGTIFIKQSVTCAIVCSQFTCGLICAEIVWAHPKDNYFSYSCLLMGMINSIQLQGAPKLKALQQFNFAFS